MKVFTVFILLALLLVFFGASALSDLDLTPGNDGVAQNTQMQPALAIPLAPTPGAASQVAGVPVTGGQVIAQTYPTAVVPVASVPITGIPVTGTCPNPYVVSSGESLSKIARACGTNITALLALNTNITNANVIYPGQVLWIYGYVNVPPVPTPNIPVTGGGLPPVVKPGSSLTVNVRNFPPQTPVNIGVGRPGIGYQVVNTGITDMNGSLRATAVVPATNDPDQTWIVMVVTTNGPIVHTQSEPFTILPTP